MGNIPDYLSFVPKSGTGNQLVRVNSTSVYKGRENRTTEVVGRIVGKTNSVNVNVIEEKHAEFISPDGYNISVSKEGGIIHITGKSNSKILTFTWQKNFGIADVVEYKVNSDIISESGVEIEGDPGASNEYSYDVTLVIPKNDVIQARSAELQIQGESLDVVKTITITQALGDSYIYLNEEGVTNITITLPQDGSEQIFEVLSNDEWTFEPSN